MDATATTNIPGTMEILPPGRSPYRTLSPREERLAIWIAEEPPNITPSQLAHSCSLNWGYLRRDPAFQDAIDKARELMRADSFKSSLARREMRIAFLIDRAERLQQIITQRAQMANPESRFYRQGADNVPGADTGMLIPSIKSFRNEDGGYSVVDQWELDATLLAQERMIAEQVAKETGQWAERHIVEQTVKAYIGIQVEEV